MIKALRLARGITAEAREPPVRSLSDVSLFLFFFLLQGNMAASTAVALILNLPFFSASRHSTESEQKKYFATDSLTEEIFTPEIGKARNYIRKKIMPTLKKQLWPNRITYGYRKSEK